jgi:hypothetical protein
MGLEAFLLFLSGAFGPNRGVLEGPAYDTRKAELGSLFDPQTRHRVEQDNRAITPKLCPAQGWIFEWLTVGYFQKGESQAQRRFRIFSQARLDQDDLEIPVGRLVSRLHDYNLHALRRDLNEGDILSDLNTVDIYLCFGGDPGAEWRPGQEPGPNNSVLNVNVIYIYQLESLTKPIDRLREVAHEFGHATLPALRGYTEPEAFVNGDIGERIYLRWIRKGLAEGRIDAGDVMNVSMADLDTYLERRVEPLEAALAADGPDPEALRLRGRAAFNQATAAGLIAERINPRLLLRSMDVSAANPDPAFFMQAVATEASLLPSWDFTRPPHMKSSTVWLPIGSSRVVGGRIIQRRLGWAQVAMEGESLQVFAAAP